MAFFLLIIIAAIALGIIADFVLLGARLRGRRHRPSQ